MEQNLLKIDFTERHTFLEKLSYYFCSFVCNHNLFPAFSNNNFKSSVDISVKGTG